MEPLPGQILLIVVNIKTFLTSIEKNLFWLLMELLIAIIVVRINFFRPRAHYRLNSKWISAFLSGNFSHFYNIM